MQQALSDPRNAAELAFLVTSTPHRPTLQARVEALAFLHSQGWTLDPGLADAKALSAWAQYMTPTMAGTPSAAVPPRSSSS